MAGNPPPINTGGIVAPGASVIFSPPTGVGRPATRSGSIASASYVRGPRSANGTPTARHAASPWTTPPVPTPSSTRSPERICSVAICFAAHAT
jgi:hypothetical protein